MPKWMQLVVAAIAGAFGAHFLMRYWRRRNMSPAQVALCEQAEKALDDLENSIMKKQDWTLSYDSDAGTIEAGADTGS